MHIYIYSIFDFFQIFDKIDKTFRSARYFRDWPGRVCGAGCSFGAHKFYRFSLGRFAPHRGSADSERERTFCQAIFYICGVCGVVGLGGGGVAGVKNKRKGDTKTKKNEKCKTHFLFGIRYKFHNSFFIFFMFFTYIYIFYVFI